MILACLDGLRVVSRAIILIILKKIVASLKSLLVIT